MVYIKITSLTPFENNEKLIHVRFMEQRDYIVKLERIIFEKVEE